MNSFVVAKTHQREERALMAWKVNIKNEIREDFYENQQQHISNEQLQKYNNNK
jgi:hypothetical protein